MSNIIDVLYRDYFVPYKRLVLILFLMVVFIILGYFGYQWYAKPQMANKEMKDIANANRRNPTVEIFFFHVDWCPHCKTAVPEWKKFMAQYDGDQYNGYTIKCIDLNCTDDIDAQGNPVEPAHTYISQFGIEGYPTVKMMKNGQTVSFDSKITKSSLETLLSKELNE